MVEELPDDAPFDKILEELERAHFRAEVQIGLDELDRGLGIPHEQVMEEMERWLDAD
ncbi:MAG: hypothetical protein KC910_14500 [Candidatus Eremiobacteraeota bacterium]|nr:hypothetical protein [Candidatus Eremiobacteraeota bacterium]